MAGSRRAPGFIVPCQPALADIPPSGPGWLHELKFDGYRVIARKDGGRVRLWARTTSDYSRAFTRIRENDDPDIAEPLELESVAPR
jgi:bifunctional non-homologous end joining protein LigD